MSWQNKEGGLAQRNPCPEAYTFPLPAWPQQQKTIPCSPSEAKPHTAHLSPAEPQRRAESFQNLQKSQEQEPTPLLTHSHRHLGASLSNIMTSVIPGHTRLSRDPLPKALLHSKHTLRLPLGNKLLSQCGFLLSRLLRHWMLCPPVTAEVTPPLAEVQIQFTTPLAGQLGQILLVIPREPCLGLQAKQQVPLGKEPHF